MRRVAEGWRNSRLKCASESRAACARVGTSVAAPGSASRSGPSRGGDAARGAGSPSDEYQASSLICAIRMWFPDGSRKPASTPYGCSVGSWVNSTPRPLNSSYVARKSSAWKNRPLPRALGDELLELAGRLLVEDRRPWDRQERDGDVFLPRNADGEPPKVAHLRNGDVLTKLETELLCVESERLVLVDHPHTCMAEVLQHRFLRSRGVIGGAR